MIAVGTLVFLLILTDYMHDHDNRNQRTIMFVIFGAVTTLPLLHLFYEEYILFIINSREISMVYLPFHFLQALIYLTGVIFYLFRWPEKQYPYVFDFIG